MRKYNTFKQGSGCFRCEYCGKLTRDTGQDNVGVYCKKCEDFFYAENEKADKGLPSINDIKEVL